MGVPETEQHIEIPPDAAALLQSLRGLGYSPETALADIVDNSISASARSIELTLDWNEGEPRVEILDDGRGMDFATLAQAMKFGGAGPGVGRSPDDLGRFGLGLKTAALSQCRLLTVTSRVAGVTSSIAWDVDEVERTGLWQAQIPPSPLGSAYAQVLASREHGTLVAWDRMDALGGLFGLDKTGFFERIADIRAHLGMVFHRFLDGDARRIAIKVNGRPVTGWDPFLRKHPATQVMAADRLRSSGYAVGIAPYILPHRDRFQNEAAFEAAGGVGGWTERQGFYVYRGKRLLVAGGWLGLGGSRAWTRDDSSRLARIALDLPTELDHAWRIDIRKSIARPPAALRVRLTAVAGACRHRAREVFAWRGGTALGGSHSAEPLGPVWLGSFVGGRARYRINREHLAIARVAACLGGQSEVLETALRLIERTVPVEQIWLDVSESADATPALTEDDIAEMAPRLADLVATMKTGSVDQRLDGLLRPLRIDSQVLRASIIALLEPADE